MTKTTTGNGNLMITAAEQFELGNVNTYEKWCKKKLSDYHTIKDNLIVTVSNLSKITKNRRLLCGARFLDCLVD